MAISVDWTNKLVLSTASITDIIAFKDTIRDLEDDDAGMLYDPIISFKQLDLGGGAYFYGVDFINGYQLKFPNTGNYEIVGNIGATIVPVAGVYVERKTSAAFATTSVGGSGPSAADIATEVWQHVIEAGLSAEALQRLFAAALLGKVSGAGSGVEVFRSVDDAKDRITATVDASGNRTGIVLDGD